MRQEKNFRGFDLYLTKSMYLLEAASSYGFFLMLSASYLYVLGNFQHFSSETLKFLLSGMRILGFTAIGLNVNTLLAIGIWGVRTRHFPWWRFFFAVFCLLVGFAFSLLAVFVNVLSAAT